jgi:hypothetical protein
VIDGSCSYAFLVSNLPDESVAFSIGLTLPTLYTTLETTTELYISKLEKLPQDTLQHMFTLKDQERAIKLKVSNGPVVDQDRTLDSTVVLAEQFND